MKSGCSGALKSDRLGLSCKANKCSNAGTGDLGVLTTHETSKWFSQSECRVKLSGVRQAPFFVYYYKQNLETAPMLRFDGVPQVPRDSIYLRKGTINSNSIKPLSVTGPDVIFFQG